MKWFILGVLISVTTGLAAIVFRIFLDFSMEVFMGSFLRLGYPKPIGEGAIF